MNRYLIVLILFVGCGLLLYNLNEHGLWVDEGWSISATDGGDPLAVTETVAEDVHPPLYFYTLHIWRGLTGDTVFAMRYLSVLMVMLGAAVLFRLGKMLQGEFSGLLAAALYMLHDLVRVLGQEIRQYPQGQLLTILLLWVYLRWWEKPTRPRTIALILVGLALMWTLYWGGFILLGLGIHSIVTRRKIIKPAILMGIGYIPWLPVLYSQFTDHIDRGGLTHVLPSTWEGFKVLVFQVVGQPEWFWLGLAAFSFVLFSSRRLDMRRGVLAFVVVIAVIVSVIVNTQYTMLSYRAASLLTPVLMLMVALGVSKLQIYPRLAMGLLVIIMSIGIVSARHPEHLPWQKVADFVSTHGTPQDVVLIDTWFDTYPLIYYLDKYDQPYIPTMLLWLEDQPLDFSDLESVWLVWFSSDAPTQDYLTDFVQTGVLDWETELTPISLRRYERPLPEGEFVTAFMDEDVSLRLLQSEIREVESGIMVNLWLSPEVDLTENYTVSVFLLDENGVLVTQHDSYPLENHAATVGWQADTLYFDSHYLPTDALLPGDYQLGVQVYRFLDDTFTEFKMLQPSTCAVECDFVILDHLEIQ